MRATDYPSLAIGLLNPLKEVPWRVRRTALEVCCCLRVVVVTFSPPPSPSPRAYVNQPKALIDSDMYRVDIIANIRVKRLATRLEREGVELWDFFPWPGWSLGCR
jgi:hypothetical protein